MEQKFIMFYAQKNDVTYSIFARQGISLSEIKTFLNK